MMKNDNDLFYTCSLIEYIGRSCRLKRSEVVRQLGTETLKRIYDYADVFHCEPIEKVADDFIAMKELKPGQFDNVSACRYDVPGYWDIGEVYARLIEDTGDDDVVASLQRVYASWISDVISNYNSDFFYQPRDYIAACYRENEIL